MRTQYVFIAKFKCPDRTRGSERQTKSFTFNADASVPESVLWRKAIRVSETQAREDPSMRKRDLRVYEVSREK